MRKGKQMSKAFLLYPEVHLCPPGLCRPTLKSRVSAGIPSLLPSGPIALTQMLLQSAYSHLLPMLPRLPAVFMHFRPPGARPLLLALSNLIPLKIWFQILPFQKTLGKQRPKGRGHCAG